MTLASREEAPFIFDLNHFKFDMPKGYDPLIGGDAKVGIVAQRAAYAA